MMPRVIKITPLPRYRLHVEFDDGVSGTVEIFPRLSGPVFEKLRDEAVFRQVTIDEESGAVCWPNGPDLAPDAMYSRLSGKPMFQEQQERVDAGTSRAKPQPSG
jgi:hypothetical protein